VKSKHSWSLRSCCHDFTTATLFRQVFRNLLTSQFSEFSVLLHDLLSAWDHSIMHCPSALKQLHWLPINHHIWYKLPLSALSARQKSSTISEGQHYFSHTIPYNLHGMVFDLLIRQFMSICQTSYQKEVWHMRLLFC